MTPRLCISVTFLDALFHGTGDEQAVEWPPSPFRLFQALLAGLRTGSRNKKWSDAEMQAFKWLETRAPPEIVAPVANKAITYTLYVPNNDGDEKFDRKERLAGKVVRPHRLATGDTVHYLWSIGGKMEPHARAQVEVLCRAARHMLALGWGIDQVVGHGRILSDDEVESLPGQRWVAHAVHRPGQVAHRVPKTGSLTDLQDVHASFLKRVEGRQFRPSLKPRIYDKVGYFRRSQLLPRPYAVFELPEGVSFRQVDVVKVAAMLRSMTCRQAKEDTYEFPGGSERYVAGHVKDDDSNQARFSYLPLPTIGHAHADGMVRRLLIAEPFGGDSSYAGWAQYRLRNVTLIDEGGNERGTLLDLWRSSSDDMIHRYVGESRTWSSVTPVILPGYDDFKAITLHDENQPTKAERLLIKSLVHAGIPLESIQSVTMRKAPFWPGSQHPRHYRRPDYLADTRARPAWHVYLVFREPVSGPLAVGAGRHCGLGIFAASEKRQMNPDDPPISVE